MNILVAIAHHGQRNRQYLLDLVGAWQAMPHSVEIVVLTEAAKALPSNIEQIVGCPTNDPRSLPFAHRALFSERVNEFDLFAYSEDDTLVTEDNLSAFIESLSVLGPGEIAGFIRSETDDSGHWWCSTAHGPYRWISEVCERGGDLWAHYTNVHSAAYILSRSQLTQVIQSGGFALAPHEGRYDMLCSAATDVYTRCGLVKMINISRVDRFVLRHLSNRYAGIMTRLSRADFDAQLNALKRLPGGFRDRELVPVRSKLRHTAALDKDVVIPLRREHLSRVSHPASRILSIGVGNAITERVLQARGHHVVIVPIDDSCAAPAARAGILVLEPSMRALKTAEDHGPYDVIFLDDVIGRVEKPEDLLANLRRTLASRGIVVISSPSAGIVRRFAPRRLGARSHDLRMDGLRRCSMAHAGINLFSRTRVRAIARGAHLGELDWQWQFGSRAKQILAHATMLHSVLARSFTATFVARAP